MNPGGLPGGITPGNILRHQPKRRNPLLAQVLARLGLIEQAGVGVDKMFGLMLRHGKEPPEFTTYPDAVELTLHSMGFDAEFVRFVARKQEELQTLSLDMLIVLSLLAREGEATRATLARALQLAEDRTPRLLRQMEDIGLIERAGVGRGIAYLLAPESREALQRQGLRQAMQTRPAPAEAAASTTGDHDGAPAPVLPRQTTRSCGTRAPSRGANWDWVDMGPAFRGKLNPAQPLHLHLISKVQPRLPLHRPAFFPKRPPPQQSTSTAPPVTRFGRLPWPWPVKKGRSAIPIYARPAGSMCSRPGGYSASCVMKAT
ncbi:ATP-binding protein [Deinococcus radiophilus]|uniref:ATP-binding protein n=1 Tax=Deinococcus radiophilus TaxID=32062 RepID=UPI00361FB559